jgi:hypothetical protein
MARDCITQQTCRDRTLTGQQRIARLKQAMLAHAKTLSARSVRTMFLDYCDRRHEARTTEEHRSFRAMTRGVVTLA